MAKPNLPLAFLSRFHGYASLSSPTRSRWIASPGSTPWRCYFMPGAAFIASFVVFITIYHLLLFLLVK
jgi:hypothetical protein